MKKALLFKIILIILWVQLTGFHAFAEDGEQVQQADVAETEQQPDVAETEQQADVAETEQQETEGKRLSIEFELDAYYSSVDLIASLTDKPIPDVGEKSEFEIYKDLLMSSYLPRFLLLEASVNPMPCLGVLIKRNAEDFYEDTQVSGDFNLVQTVTAGFEEPYAFSLFLGNVVSFQRPGEERKAGNNGYMGYLASAGNYHIKDNELIDDNWYEVEWKIKGSREFVTQELQWSFRIGGKFHGNPEIADVLYIAFRRSRLDYEASAKSILKNSGFEYTFDMDSRSFNPVRSYLSVDKKWPFKNEKFAFTLALGFMWEANRKYSGSLGEQGVDNFQVFLRPNLEF